MKGQLHALQILRACAAAMVVFVHALDTYENKVGPVSALFSNSSFGTFGVKLFFCISGFIIYTTSINLPPGSDTAWIFLRRRLIRVAPIYWIATLVYALKLAFQGLAPQPFDILRSMLFIPYTQTTGLMRPVLGVGWTLNYEIFFYVIFTVGMLLKGNWRLVFATVVLCAVMIARSLGMFDISGGFVSRSLYLLSENFLIYFIFGMILGYIRINAFSKGNSKAALPMGAATAAAVSLLGCYVVITCLFTMSAHWREVLMLIACVGCVGICMFEAPGKDAIPSGRVSRFFEACGNASYSTYLTHGFVMGIMARLLAYSALRIGGIEFAILSVWVCSVFGILVYVGIEKPMLKRLSSWVLPLRPGPA